MLHKNLQEILLNPTYSSLETNLVKEVVGPLLASSVQYDRGVGFFTSGWLKEAAEGLLAFVKQNGKARIVTSPNLSAQDWQTIRIAQEDRQDKLITTISIKNALSDLEENLEHDTLAALAWLIQDGILEFRFAIPQDNLEGGIFHSKLSIFLDDTGNGVALHGSQNDSTQASLNEESYSVFCSWNEGNKWFLEHQDRFNQIWDNKYKNLRIVHIEDAEREIILRYTEKFPRPYMAALQSDQADSIKPDEPRMKTTIILRDYQQKALDEWERNDRHGIFEMATGTGKTITAISAAVAVFQNEKRLALVILVPYIHLVDQWVSELQDFGFQPIRCYESANTWKQIAASHIREFNAGLTTHLCLVSTHQTASMQPFCKMVSRLQTPYLLLGDEIHELGAPSFRKGLTEKASWRIGLSATPDRWYDEEGTKVLRDYFGKTVIKYELAKAIQEKALTPYHYYPEKIDLTEEEIEEFVRLSKIIAQLGHNSKENPEKLEGLLRKRADLIGKAANKIPHLIKIVEQHRRACEEKGAKFQHILFYCNKGTHRDVLSAVNNLGLRVHEFVHDVDLRQRRAVLAAFTHGEIDGLVAIKCLDQGVDVPATRQAYILASSTNPREFVQRRGRILRKSPGKQVAAVYDFLTGPWNTSEILGKEAAKALLLRELPRFAEFSLDAINSQEARNAVWDTVKRLNLVPYLHKRPWEVYQELKNQKEV